MTEPTLVKALFVVLVDESGAVNATSDLDGPVLLRSPDGKTMEVTAASPATLPLMRRACAEIADEIERTITAERVVALLNHQTVHAQEQATADRLLAGINLNGGRR